MSQEPVQNIYYVHNKKSGVMRSSFFLLEEECYLTEGKNKTVAYNVYNEFVN